MSSSYKKYLNDFDGDSHRRDDSSARRQSSPTSPTGGFEIEGEIDDIDLFSYNSAKQRRKNEINSYLSKYESNPSQSQTHRAMREPNGQNARQMSGRDDRSVREAYGMERRPASTHSAIRRTGGEYIGSKQKQMPSKQSLGAKEVVMRANKSGGAVAQRAYTAQKNKPSEEPDGCLTSVFNSVKSTGRPLKKTVRHFAIVALMLVAAFFLLYYSIIGMMLSKINIIEIDTKWEDAPVAGTELIELRSKRNVRNVLLLGIDDDGSSGSRSDTIMIASVNTKEKQVKLCSILRDNYVDIPGYKPQKINAAYAYGGTALTMQTIQNNYRVKLDKYVSVNMKSMMSIVDIIGGVDIELTEAEAEQVNMHSQSPGHVTAGLQHLDGRQAVCFAQIRKIDSDFSRTGRQRILLEAIMNKCKSMSKIRLLKLAGEIAPYLTTNMSTKEIGDLGLKIIPAMGNGIQQMSIPAKGTYSNKMINGAAVLDGNVALNAELLHDFLYG